jgi:hypothetical protein
MGRRPPAAHAARTPLPGLLLAAWHAHITVSMLALAWHAASEGRTIRRKSAPSDPAIRA